MTEASTVRSLAYARDDHAGAISKISPILGLALGQPLDRSLQSTFPRFVALRVCNPIGVFLFVGVTKSIEGSRSLLIPVQRSPEIFRNR